MYTIAQPILVHARQFVHPPSVPFLRFPLPLLHKHVLLAQRLQPPRQRRFLGDLQRPERVQAALLLLERLRGLDDLLPEHLGSLLVAAVVQRHLLFEFVALFRVRDDGGLDALFESFFFFFQLHVER